NNGTERSEGEQGEKGLRRHVFRGFVGEDRGYGKVKRKCGERDEIKKGDVFYLRDEKVFIW
ncbi:hypothetical protein, partial [Bacillus velezensis]|uniref:hypothetical protein n=1 Tax=Bacillus velezensis TaxID=492670 RepID=UPI001C930119